MLKPRSLGLQCVLPDIHLDHKMRDATIRRVFKQSRKVEEGFSEIMLGKTYFQPRLIATGEDCEWASLYSC